MKRTFLFHDEMIICEQEQINENEFIINLPNDLKLNGWVVDKKILYKGFVSQYKYNIANFFTIKLTDNRSISRCIIMHQEIYVDFQLSRLQDREEFNAIDWEDFDKKDLIKKMEVELTKLNSDPKSICKLIEFAEEFKNKVVEN